MTFQYSATNDQVLFTNDSKKAAKKTKKKTVKDAVAFIRIKLMGLDPAPSLAVDEYANVDDALLVVPYCAVSVKELASSVVTTTTTSNMSAIREVAAEAAAAAAAAAATSTTTSKQSVQLEHVQLKATFYPKWNTSFDCHVHEGRIIHLAVRNKINDAWLAEATVDVASLANTIKQSGSNTLNDWVHK